MGLEDSGLNLRQITFSAVRLVAVYLLAQTLFHFPQAAQIVFSGDGVDGSNWGFLAGLVLVVAVSILLWTQASGLVRLVMRDSDRQSWDTAITAQDIELVAFALLGIFIIVGGIPQLVSSIAQLIAPSTFDQFLPPDGPSDNYRLAKALDMMSALFRVVVGIWLVLGTRSFSTLLRRFRERAISGPEINE